MTLGVPPFREGTDDVAEFPLRRLAHKIQRIAHRMIQGLEIAHDQGGGRTISR